MKVACGLLVASLALAPLPAMAQQVPELSMDLAVLQGLDKVTAHVVTIEAPVGKPVRFGTLEIIARSCKKAQSVFRGWMFASSPALSAMEHPVYDIRVLDCESSR